MFLRRHDLYLDEASLFRLLSGFVDETVASVTPLASLGGLVALPHTLLQQAAAQFDEAPLSLGSVDLDCLLLSAAAVARLDLATASLDDALAELTHQGMAHLLIPAAVAFGRWGEGQQRQAAVQRFALALQALRDSPLPVMLQVTHAMGGGVERYVRELLDCVAGRAWSLVLRPQPGGQSVRLSFEGESLCFAWPQQAEQLAGLLRGVGLAQVHVQHVAGYCADFWPWLLALEAPLDLTLHDYTIIGGSPTLTDRRGHYRAPAPGVVHELANPLLALSLRQLASAARRCIVPSEDMRLRLAEQLPELELQVRPHPDRERIGAYPAPHVPPLSGPLRVMCLGALGREKGLEELRQVAALARRRGAPLEFLLLGSAHVAPGRAVTELGRYIDAELPALLAAHQPHLLWFPVRWPETWSYTLSAALEAGVPVLACDLGAFAERLRGRPLSWLQAPGSDAEAWLQRLLEVRERLQVVSVPENWAQASPVPFYWAEYLAPQALGVLPSLPPVHAWGSPAAVSLVAPCWRQSALRLVLALYRRPLVGAMLRWLPYNLLRQAKRLFSSAPIP
ncbi:glycosyltransferase [Pseudomonas sp. KB-10]|uniref:glycosyltransferase n=1 Tax=Pseudomonas sp. KB-10 TaxID=2292264 RepID=UPI001BAE887F|nr:glycosyltransferase [Pseudomonas sp. KB-10]